MIERAARLARAGWRARLGSGLASCGLVAAGVVGAGVVGAGLVGVWAPEAALAQGLARGAPHTSGAQENGPDFSGFWGADFGIDPTIRIPELLEKLPAGAVLIEDAGVAEFPRGEFGGLQLTPMAAARAEQWDAAQDLSVDRVCLPPSIVYAVQGPFPFEIHQTPELIVFRYEYFDQVRLIHMDGRSVPEGVPPSKMGYSVGRFEGEDLVIETTRIAASTITNNGLDHTDDIRMTERYRLADGGRRLHATQWFSDPAALATDGARYITWTSRPGEFVYPYECDPSFALEYAEGQGGP